ncbi:MAG: hypothetical protein ACRDOO_20260, partial [Actinomadura sp.]
PGGVAGATSGRGGAGASTGPSASASANGLAGIEGGSGQQQNTRPVGFNGPSVPGLGALPALVLLAALVVPPTVMVVNRWIRARGQKA